MKKVKKKLDDEKLIYYFTQIKSTMKHVWMFLFKCANETQTIKICSKRRDTYTHEKRKKKQTQRPNQRNRIRWIKNGNTQNHE